MGTYHLGVYAPAIGEVGWGDEVNDALTRLSETHINVKAAPYAAVGDGVADDTSAIQAAINAATGIVYVPPGNYKITSTIQTRSGITIQGAGAVTQFLHYAGTTPLFKLIPNQQRTRFRDFAIAAWDGVGYTSGTGHGIEIAGVTGGSGYITQTHIEHVSFIAVGDATHWAIKAIWGIETHISRCALQGCRGGGIYLGDTCNASTITHTTGSNGGQGALGAVLLEDVNGIRLSGNVWEAWRGSYGIKILRAGQITLDREWLEDNTGFYLWVKDSTNVTAIDSPPYTLQVDSSTNVQMRGSGSFNATLTSTTSPNAPTHMTFDNSPITGTLTTSGLIHPEDRVVFVNSRAGTGSASQPETIDGYEIRAPNETAAARGPRVSLERGYFELTERVNMNPPATNGVRIVAAENAGKTKLYAVFATGAWQLLASQP